MIKTLARQINDGIHDMCDIWWMELRGVFKDEGVLMFCLLVPLLYPLLYSWIYNNEVVREVPVAVVDLSHSKTSRDFIHRVDASPDVKIAYYCNNLAEAQSLVGHQVVHGVLYFPESFERNISRGETSRVSVYCDMSLMLTYRAIYMTAQAVSSEMGSEIQAPKAGGFTNRDDEINTQPLAFDEVQIFNASGGYGNALLPGVLILILQQTLLLGIGLAAGTARENNAYGHLVTITKGHRTGIFRIVLGKTMCYFMLYCVMAAYILLAVPHFFHLTQLVHPEPLIALVVPFLLASIFFAMIISCAVRYRENVMLLVVFTSVPFLFLSGATWPQSSIAGAWQGIGWLIPSTFGIRGFIRLNSMGATLGDIRTEYQALWIQVAVYFFITCLMYRWQILRAIKKLKQTENA